MMKIALSVLTAMLAASTWSVAHADDDEVAEMQAIAQTVGLLSLDEAKQRALAAKPGTIIEADLDKRLYPQGWDYEFEIVDAQGMEWEVEIDAKTGDARRVMRDWF